MFGFVYEDYDIEINSIKKYLKQKNNNLLNGPNGLMILSGGCTMFEIAKYFDYQNLTAIDFNPKQIKLVKNKLSLSSDPDGYKEFILNTTMTFDNLFEQIKLGESFDSVFSNDNLIEKFGPSAVINTEKSFSNHFENIYKQYLLNKTSSSYEWIWSRNLDIKCTFKPENIPYIFYPNIIIGNMTDYLFHDAYDFIQTSNLTDWMEKDEFKLFCSKIKLSLKTGGIVIMRRLLSTNILETEFEGCEILHDKTNFYKETICWVKK